MLARQSAAFCCKSKRITPRRRSEAFRASKGSMALASSAEISACFKSSNAS